jgi:hypothetical protein
MDDEEFIAGKLDTGFIQRFNERKRAAPHDERTRDLAMIAAALAFSSNDRNALPANGATSSKWARIGREMALSNRL